MLTFKINLSSEPGKVKNKFAFKKRHGEGKGNYHDWAMTKRDWIMQTVWC